MATKTRFTVLCLTLLAAFIALSDSARAQKTKAPFPVKYRITFVRHPEGTPSYFHRMNNAGIAISLQGYLFDSVTGEACWDVRELIDDDDLRWIPENGILFPAGISDNGYVAGGLQLPDDSGHLRTIWAYVLVTGNDLSQKGRIKLIDSEVLPMADRTYAYGVNNVGDVLGAYRDSFAGTWHLFTWNLFAGEEPLLFDHLPVVIDTDYRYCPVLNNCGQIAGKLRNVDGKLLGFRYTPPWGTVKPDRLETFPELTGGFDMNTGMNDDGVLCGKFTYMTRNRLDSGPYRCYFTEGIDSPVALGSVSQNYQWPVRINSSCDLLLSDSAKPLIYHDASKYLFDVQSLVDVSNLSSEDLALWKSRTDTLFRVDHMTDRYPDPENAKSLGRLCGGLGYYDGRWTDPANWRSVGFVLTPQYQ